MIHDFQQEDKQLIVTHDEEVLSKPQLQDTLKISPCSHKEADTRMFLHVYHAVRHGHRKILVQTVDTDVVVLAVSTAQNLIRVGALVGIWHRKTF